MSSRAVVLPTFVAATVAVAWSLSASGTPVRVTLDYRADLTLVGCPGVDAVRQALAAKLGYDPFAQPADSEVVLRVRDIGQGIEGSLELTGARKGRRVIDSPGLDCREVVETLVVAAAIALDPTVLARPATSAASSSASSTVPPPPAPAAASSRGALLPAPAAPAAPATRRTFSIVAGPALLVGELPRAAPAIEAGASLRVGQASLAVTGLATTEVETPSSLSGRGRASLIAGNVQPCAHTAGWTGCLLASVGVIGAEGVDVDVARRATRTTAAAGVVVGHDWHVLGLVSGGAYATGAVSLQRTTLVVNGQEAWSTPRLLGRFGCRMTFSF